MKTCSDLHRFNVLLNAAAVFYCPEGWSLDSRWAGGLHDYDLWYVWGGRGRMVTTQGAIDLYPGRGVWMRPGRRYEATHGPKALLRVTAVHFQMRNGARLLRMSEFTPPVEVFDASSPDYFGSALRHVVELQAQDRASRIAALLFKSLLLEIAERGQPQTPETPLQRHHRLMLGPIIAAIHESPDRRFSVAELAAESGYTTDHFVRLFRAATGLSPKAFMVKRRMERAQTLLKESSQTVSQIAETLGYQDLGFFSRQFTAEIGMSPSRCR